MTGFAVYGAVNAVSLALSREGIGKTRQSAGGGSFKFRGIDEVMNALAPLLVANKLIIVPRILERECTERTMRSGAVMFYVTVAAEFDFISAEDGSKFTARTYGEAMDAGDKATNKAMAIAYKYAAFQTFCIPTEGSGDTDPDATVHEPVAPKQQEPKPEASKPDGTSHTGAASVPAANSRKTVKDIPAVAPTRDPVPGRGDFAAPHPESWKERERAQLSKGATEQLLVGEDGNGGLGAIITGIGISKLEIIEAQFVEWRKRANQGWKRINEADRLRIGNRVAEYNKLVEQERASRDVALGAEKPAISRGDDYDRETGEILEPAE